MGDHLCERYQTIRQTIASCSSKATNLTLLGASKTQPAERIEAAINLGITHFGENKVQEAQAKWPELKRKYADVNLHLIGALQSNKAKEALELFDVIQTIDRKKLADVVAANRSSWRPGFSCYIQINTGAEPQKGGVLPGDADQFIAYCTDQKQLPVAGLMCIPPVNQPAAPHFALLRKIAEHHGLPHLSMGMSDDYAAAIRLGATCIRLGRALFGERVNS